MSASPEFQRTIRLRSLLKPTLLPASLSGLLAGLLLVILIGACGAMAWLLIETSHADQSGSVMSSLRETLLNFERRKGFTAFVGAFEDSHFCSALRVASGVSGMCWRV